MRNLAFLASWLVFGALACGGSVGGDSSSGGSGPANGGGGSGATGGARTGNGGASTGGGSTGGASGTGGGGSPNSGGAAGTGGASGTGGAPGAGGMVDSGSAGSGGARRDGGVNTGGSPGTGGIPIVTDGGPLPGYLIGADVTFVQADEARGTTYSDGTTKEFFRLMADHGFNAMRLRTFVDPRAADGYDKTNGYADLAHTITFGRRIKAAGMTFLLDFHYSDNWADPGKQCVPVAWQGMSLTQMAQALHDYTRDAITQLIAGGARPDIVQIGNEITPGMLIHICDAGGQPTGNSAVNGAWSGNSPNLGTFLKAGANAIREVDPSIKIMLHIDRGGDKPTDRAGSALQTSINFITYAMSQGVSFDVFGESCYQVFQGDPASPTVTQAGWTNTFTQLAMRYPNIKFVAAEYGAMEREINDVVFNVPGQQGLGTFYWEPTRQTQGNQGRALFTLNGNPRTTTADMALYDQMKTAFAGRL